MKTLFTFKSDTFNTSNEKDYFINPNNYGDDVMSWLMEELTKENFAVITTKPSQEDYGWFLNFIVDSKKYCVVIGLRPEDSTWIGWIERARGLFGSLFLGREKGISRDVVFAIHKILSHSNKIVELKWHEQKYFDKGVEDVATNTP
jgi:hypothetical protein